MCVTGCLVDSVHHWYFLLFVAYEGRNTMERIITDGWYDCEMQAEIICI